MKFVEILTDTKTPYGNFFDGEIRKVDDDVAGYLIGNGWARPQSVKLEVQNASLGVNSEEVSGG